MKAQAPSCQQPQTRSLELLHRHRPVRFINSPHYIDKGGEGEGKGWEHGARGRGRKGSREDGGPVHSMHGLYKPTTHRLHQPVYEPCTSHIGSTWTFRAQDLSFPRTKSLWGLLVPGNFRSRDHSFLGTFVPQTILSRELLFPVPGGTFVPRTFRSQELSFTNHFTKH